MIDTQRRVCARSERQIAFELQCHSRLRRTPTGGKRDISRFRDRSGSPFMTTEPSLLLDAGVADDAAPFVDFAPATGRKARPAWSAAAQGRARCSAASVRGRIALRAAPGSACRSPRAGCRPGAKAPFQVTTSKPVTPASSTVGHVGRVGRALRRGAAERADLVALDRRFQRAVGLDDGIDVVAQHGGQQIARRAERHDDDVRARSSISADWPRDGWSIRPWWCRR